MGSEDTAKWAADECLELADGHAEPNPARAAEYYRRAAALYGRAGETAKAQSAYQAAAKYYDRAGDPGRALWALKRGGDPYPNEEKLQAAADLAFESGNIDLWKDLLLVLEHGPDWMDKVCGSAKVLMKDEKFAEAARVWTVVGHLEMAAEAWGLAVSTAESDAEREAFLAEWTRVRRQLALRELEQAAEGAQHALNVAFDAYRAISDRPEDARRKQEAFKDRLLLMSR